MNIFISKNWKFKDLITAVRGIFTTSITTPTANIDTLNLTNKLAESKVDFNISSGHDHDGINSKLITIPVPPIPDNWVSTVSDVRALTSHVDTQDIGCLANTGLYTYFSANSTADDGVNYLKPNDVIGNGRWVLQKVFEDAANKENNVVDNSTTKYPTVNLMQNFVYTQAKLLNAGVTVQPTITDHGSGLVDIDATTCIFNNQADFSGLFTSGLAAALNGLQLVANQYTYIVANYNSGTPILQAITDNTIINHSTILNVVQLYWENVDSINELHTFFTGNYGLGLANKTSHRLIHTERFGYESGLQLSEYGTRNIRIETGKLWYDSYEIDTNLITSATAGHEIHYYYPISSVFHASKVTQYPNTSYSDGSNIQSLTGNKYCPIFVFVAVSNTGNHSYIVLGGEYSAVADALIATMPTLPDIIVKQAKFVGRIIIKNGDSTATKITNELTATNSQIITSNHALLSNLDYASSGHTGFQASLGYTAENSANKDISGGYVGKTLESINFWNAARTFMSFLTNAATAIRTYTFPDNSGTIALTSDITGTNSGTNTGDNTFSNGVTQTVKNVTNDLITGKSGGQTIIGGTGASEKLILTSTSNSTIGGVEVGTTTNGENLTVVGALGSELAPALTTGNYTLGTGWSYGTSPNRIDKTIDGTGTITPTAATTIVAGNTYKVVITVNSISGSTASYTLGGITGQTLSAATTYTDYIIAGTTGKLIITPTATGLRTSITAISITQVSQGKLTVHNSIETESIRAINGVSTDGIFINQNGFVGIGKRLPTVAFDVSGAITSNGTITGGSLASTSHVGATYYRGSNTDAILSTQFLPSSGGYNWKVQLMGNQATTSMLCARYLSANLSYIGLNENTLPTADIDFNGIAARVIQIARNITNSTAGQNLTIKAGGTTGNGAIATLSPNLSANGSGYTAGDIITIDGGTGGTFVYDSGNKAYLVSEGSGYTTGSGKTTTGGTGTGMTVNITAVRTSTGNLNGGDLILSSGIATGNGGSKLQFQTVALNQGSGTTDRNPTTKAQILQDGSFEIVRGNYIYEAQTLGADTIGDFRTYTDSNGVHKQYCTVGNATKGAGTWVEWKRYTAQTANYNILIYDGVIDCTSNTFTVTLPTAANLVSRNASFYIKNSGSGVITVNTTSSQTIDSQLTQTVNSGSCMQVMSTGSNWIII